jgi:hypothetical protein
MNAEPTPLARALQLADYEPHVHAFLPGCGGEELEIRSALLLMRDCAAAAKTHCTDEAYPLLEHVEHLASRFAFQGMLIEDLRDLRTAMRKLVAAAASIDEWAGKGIDGRG